jgi:hypothetical protein
VALVACSSGTTAQATSTATIAGSVAGTPFTAAPTSLWIGSPDSVATAVVYLFSGPVDCAALAAAGWDSRLPSDTQVLEMKVFGTAPATYGVVKSANPASGQASVNHTLSKQVGTPVETAASSGVVAVSEVHPHVDIKGTFSLRWADGSLDGTFDAVFCPGGVEP